MSQLVSKVLSTSTVKIALIGTFTTVIALGVCPLSINTCFRSSLDKSGLLIISQSMVLPPTKSGPNFNPNTPILVIDAMIKTSPNINHILVYFRKILKKILNNLNFFKQFIQK